MNNTFSGLHGQLLPRSLMARLTLYYAMAFIVLLGLCFTLLYWSVGTVFDQRMDEELQEDIAELSQLLQQSGFTALVQELDAEASGKETESLFIFVYDRSTTPVYVSDLTHWAGFKPSLDPVKQLLHGESPDDISAVLFSQIELPDREEPVRVVTAPLSREYVIVLGELLEERADVMEVLRAAFASAFIIAIPLAGVLVWLLTRKAISGIRQVSDTALAISSGNLEQRVRASGQVTEVQLLADTFDAMADRIQHLIRNMREMTDNIAHDLRSPLGRIRLLAESTLHHTSDPGSKHQAAERTVRECDQLIDMINVSLDVAESEAGAARMHKEPLHAADLVADVCEMFEPAANDKNITLSFVSPQGTNTMLLGDANSLQRMLANIIDNAVKFTPGGGAIVVTVRHSDATLHIDIADNGIGINAAELETVFDRFYRSDPSRSRSGCGLGLSYARAVARSHGGEITASMVESGGTLFSIALPAAESATRQPSPAAHSHA